MLSLAEKKFLTEQLSLYDCTEREAEIYLEILRRGPSTVYEISGALGDNRITIHSACAQLLKKGLLFESRKGKRRLLVAESPEVLFKLLSSKEAELESAKANLAYAVKLLNKNYSYLRSQPSVKFYEGVDGFRRMLELTLESKSEFLGLINVELFAKYLDPEFLKSYFMRRSRKGIHSKLIWPRLDNFAKEVIKQSNELKIQVRILESKTEWSSGFISWDNSLSLKSFRDGQITCTIVENKDIVGFYRELIFPYLWNQAKRVISG